MATTTPPRHRRSAPRAPGAVQRSFDELGAPLFDVTFCVLDLETTGASPATCAITEIGAVKVRGGECLGSFHTLVNPGVAIPPEITVLTGITEAMVIPAPKIDEVLPSLQEFVAGTVIVGHNVRFDLSFLNAAFTAAGRGTLTNRVVDTLALARRLVRDEVPNCKLGTLASRFRLPHQPAHRALDDALATADLLHLLLERAGGLGVTGLDDLLALPSMSGHAQAGKLKLTTELPRNPGVYLFRDHRGHVLYVGKASNLRARVRSYFSSDDRRKIGQLLRETAVVDHQVCATTLEAAVLEIRLIHALLPRFNRQSTTFGKYCYLKLTLNEPFPRLSVTRTAKPDGGLYLGPLTSSASAALVADAIHTALPLRRCTERLRAPGSVRANALRDGPCSFAQLGVSHCPCSGDVSPSDYQHTVDLAVRGLRGEPSLLFAPLIARMAQLASAERFEEAAATRDRAAALSAALRRTQRLDQLRRAERLVLHIANSTVELRHGFLTAIGEPAEPFAPRFVGNPGSTVLHLDPPPMGESSIGGSSHITPKHHADELLAVASWLERNATKATLLGAEGEWSTPWPALPPFTPMPVRS